MHFERGYDVLVAGAGVAGVAAALESARSGLKTALVEKTIFPGGLATSGLVFVYLPLCDGYGTQVTYGLAEELLHASIRYGPGDLPEGWNGRRESRPTERYMVAFSPASFVLALDELLSGAGVTLWLDSLACTPAMSGDRITGIEIENKSGRGLLWAHCVIDATGDADIAWRAGAECVEASSKLTMWAIEASLASARRAAEASRASALLDVVQLGADAAGNHAPPGSGDLAGTDAEQVTRFILESRKLLREHYMGQQGETGAERHNRYPLTLPAMAQFRTTRRIAGRATLSGADDGRRFADSIGMVPDWRRPGPVLEIPYSTLLPERIRGLLCAGRCISSEGDAWEVTRVIPAAALTGQAAGAAAVLSVRNDTTPDRVDVAQLQERLREHGVRLLHRSDLKVL